ncbi:50S ribosomal protein L29 [Formicincola oecophyllae]|uniref:Large ribosomal subunit protein uL29 n=1 Tax=Formicincola oecophyllae TaxID=2558361 RepID=A0A4Y6U9W0_9PROT|nr:50S ribosomal protein L29 [Formicincola oecophyllae]QDH13151.1 50S ribosomal protein L29 [Formicincola oecophyllae]
MAEAYKIADLRAKSPDELKALLVQLKRDQINQRFAVATGQSEQTSPIKQTRRAVARIKTLLNEMKLKAEAKASAKS